MPIVSSPASAEEHVHQLGAESFGRFQRCVWDSFGHVSLNCTRQEGEQL